MFVCFVTANLFEANRSVVIRHVIRLSQRNQAFFNFLFPGKFYAIVLFVCLWKNRKEPVQKPTSGSTEAVFVAAPGELKAFKLPVRRSPTHLHCCFVGIVVGRPPEDAVTYY